MGTENTQFHCRFRFWRRKARERSSIFSLRFTAIDGSVFVGPRLKVGVPVMGRGHRNQEFWSKIQAEVREGHGSWVFETPKSFLFAPRGREPSYPGLFLI